MQIQSSEIILADTTPGLILALWGIARAVLSHFCLMGLTAQNSLRKPRRALLPHGPHEVRRVILPSSLAGGRAAGGRRAGAGSRLDPGGAPAGHVLGRHADYEWVGLRSQKLVLSVYRKLGASLKRTLCEPWATY